MAVYIYVRVSHRSSAESGLSEQSQIRSCVRYCIDNRLIGDLALERYPDDVPSGVFCDRAVSAFKKDFQERPGGFALSKCLRPGDTIVFYSIDRAFRNVKNFAKSMCAWADNNITPVFVTLPINLTTPTGKLMAHIWAAMAQYHSDLISARAREALAVKALRESARGASPNARKRNKGAIHFDIVPPPPRDTKQKIVAPARILIYNRVSSVDQTLSGLGMDVQRNGNLRYAELLKERMPNLTETIVLEDESVSAFKVPLHERPSGKVLINTMRQGDQVIIYRSDRAFRRIGDAARFCEIATQRGVGFHISSEGIDSTTPMGASWLSLMGDFASIESEIKSKATKEAIRIIRDRGGIVSKPKLARILRTSTASGRYDRRLSLDYHRASWIFSLVILSDVYGRLGACDICHAYQCTSMGIRTRVRGFRQRSILPQRIRSRYISTEPECIPEYKNEVAHYLATLKPNQVDAIAKRMVKFFSLKVPDYNWWNCSIQINDDLQVLRELIRHSGKWSPVLEERLSVRLNKLLEHRKNG